MEMLWALAAYAPAVVLEANFWPDDPRHRAHVQALGTVPVEVHCVCPVEECLRRYAERAASRHVVHVDQDASRASAAAFERSARPLGLGPVISVDTTGPVDTGDARRAGAGVAARGQRVAVRSQPDVVVGRVWCGPESIPAGRRVCYMIEQLFVRVSSLVVVRALRWPGEGRESLAGADCRWVRVASPPADERPAGQLARQAGQATRTRAAQRSPRPSPTGASDGTERQGG